MIEPVQHPILPVVQMNVSGNVYFHGAGHLLGSTRVTELTRHVAPLRISAQVPSLPRSYASVAQTTGFGAGSALGLTMMLISPFGRTVALPPFAPS